MYQYKILRTQLFFKHNYFLSTTIKCSKYKLVISNYTSIFKKVYTFGDLNRLDSHFL